MNKNRKSKSKAVAIKTGKSPMAGVNPHLSFKFSNTSLLVKINNPKLQRGSAASTPQHDPVMRHSMGMNDEKIFLNVPSNNNSSPVNKKSKGNLTYK